MRIHIRIHQMKGGKKVTTIENLDTDLDLKMMCREMKRKFSCNGSVKKDDHIIMLQGDHRVSVENWLRDNEIANDIMTHG